MAAMSCSLTELTARRCSCRRLSSLQSSSTKFSHEADVGPRARHRAHSRQAPGANALLRVVLEPGLRTAAAHGRSHRRGRYHGDVTRRIREFVMIKPGDMAVDIGCNDGTLLQSYHSRELDLIGFDPALCPSSCCRVRCVLSACFATFSASPLGAHDDRSSSHRFL